MKTYTLRTCLKKTGFKILEWTNGYNYRSAFVEKDGKLYYVNLEDLRDNEPTLMIRTAMDTKDYRGGPNHFCLRDYFERNGYNCVEKRKKCDYNAL